MLSPVPILCSHFSAIAFRDSVDGVGTQKKCFPLSFLLLLVQPNALHSAILYDFVRLNPEIDPDTMTLAPANSGADRESTTYRHSLAK